jgi:hypothetical protein
MNRSSIPLLTSARLALVAFTLGAGLTLACVGGANPVAPATAHAFETVVAPHPHVIAFAESPGAAGAPTEVNGERVEIDATNVYSPRGTIRSMQWNRAAGWSLVLYELVNQDPGVSPVCVDNASGYLVRCRAETR